MKGKGRKEGKVEGRMGKENIEKGKKIKGGKNEKVDNGKRGGKG